MQIAPPLVSVVITTYNREKFLKQSIASVLAQTYQHLEVIIIDDGSDDLTAQVVADFTDERITYHFFAHTGNASLLKNLGLSFAKGEYIAFNDSDDLWKSTKIEKQVNILQQNKETGFCLCNGYNFFDEQSPVDYFYPSKEGFIIGNLFERYFSSELSGFCQALLVKKECLNEIGNFQQVPLSEIYCILDLAKKFEGALLFEPLVMRRLHKQNMSSVHWKRKHQFGLDIIKHYRAFLPTDLYKKAMYQLHINFGEVLLQQGEHISARQQFFKAWQCKPIQMAPLKKIAKTIVR